MTRRRRFAAPLALLSAFLLGSCAHRPPSAPAAPSAIATLDVEGAAPRAESAPRPDDDPRVQIAALEAAEAELDRVVGRTSQRELAGKDDEARAPASPKKVGQEKGERRASPPRSSGPGQPLFTDDPDERPSPGDRCATACSALASMERAAAHLCALTGDGDALCDSARGRVVRATERVSASCPACPR